MTINRLLIAILLVAAGCDLPAPQPPAVELRPLVAVAGVYALTAAKAKPVDPTPAPVPPVGGCVEKCRCGGTGVEKSGDGLHTGPCRCPDSCDCKKRKAATSGTCTTGTCGWPPRNTTR